MTTQKTYQLGLSFRQKLPHCIEKFWPVFGDLYWSSTWQQLHAVQLSRPVIDLNWKITHGVLYTASRLVNSFGYKKIDVVCFCRCDAETLEHQILINWVFFQLLRVVPDATPFTVRELLLGFCGSRRRRIPTVIKWMLLVMKHQIWVARCDLRFHNIPPDEAKCQKIAIARIKFLLRVLASKYSSSSQKTRAF